MDAQTATKLPTDAEAGVYALSLFAGQRPLIWDIVPGSETVVVIVRADDVGGDGFANVEVWYEADGRVYGEW